MKTKLCAPASLVVAALCLGPVMWPADTPAAPDPAYVQVTNERADKIVAALGIADSAATLRVRDLIAGYYRQLNRLHGVRDAAIDRARGEAGNDAARADAAVQEIREESEAEVFRGHVTFLARLAAELTPEQVNRVKDGLTYGVLPGTYKYYLELYPTLTDEQKRQVLAWLVEAREYAMDGGSSDEKHAVFGKYKGRINNFLSAAGYDAKQAEREWQERQRARGAARTE